MEFEAGTAHMSNWVLVEVGNAGGVEGGGTAVLMEKSDIGMVNANIEREKGKKQLGMNTVDHTE
jgi:hypothetical protein